MSRSPFLVCDFDFKSVKEDNPDFFEIEGFASVYGNLDSYRDIVMPGSFAKDLLENGNERPILWQHNSDQPIGVGQFEEKGDAGLFVKIQMPKTDSFVAERVMPQIRIGAVKGLSIGYFTAKEEYDREQRINKLQELKLRETSAVTFPANELAQITAAKQFLGLEESLKIPMHPLASEDTPWDEKAAIEDLKKSTNSIDNPSKQYRKGFLYHNEKANDDFDSYSLPYCMGTKDGLKIVPNAIYSAVGSLIGKKCTVPMESIAPVKDFLNEVYKKMGKEEPFKGSSIFIDTATLKCIKKQDLIAAIGSDKVIFSTNAKETIATALCCQKTDGPVIDGDEENFLAELKKLNKSIGDM